MDRKRIQLIDKNRKRQGIISSPDSFKQRVYNGTILRQLEDRVKCIVGVHNLNRKIYAYDIVFFGRLGKEIQNS